MKCSSLSIARWKIIDLDDALGKISSVYSPISNIVADMPVVDIDIRSVAIGGICASTFITRTGIALCAGRHFDAYHVNIPLSGQLIQFDEYENSYSFCADDGARVYDSISIVSSRFAPNSSFEGLSFDADAVHAELAQHLERPIAGRIRFHDRIQNDAPALMTIKHLRDALYAGAESESTLKSAPAAMASLRESLLRAFLFGVAHGYTEALFKRTPSLSPRQVRRAMEYMRAHASQPLTLADIVSSSGVGARALQISFQRFLGIAPLEFLRQVRLEKVREELLNIEDSVRISDIARRWGFAHMGLFAARYRAAYGEHPSETIKGVRRSG